MNTYQWYGGPRHGTFMSLGSSDNVVRVAKPPDRAVWQRDDLEPVKIAYIECEVDHEHHKIIWPEPNWRGYWTDERPMRVYQSFTISNDDYIKKDQIMLQLECDTRRVIRDDNVVLYEGRWIIWNPDAPLYARRWQFVAKERPVYCDNRVHGPISIDARWWCPETHPDSLFERVR